MNELIEKFAEQCTVSCIDGRGVELNEIDVAKFAELIVRECADRLVWDDFGSIKGQMRIAGAKLKEHFEIKP